MPNRRVTSATSALTRVVGGSTRILRFVRFSHTIFAMPFALGSMIVAAQGLPSARIFLLIVLAMVFARTAAMLFNRIADWEFDQRNPWTAARHELLSREAAWVVLIVSTAGFVAVTWFINRLCFRLSPWPSVLSFSIVDQAIHVAQSSLPRAGAFRFARGCLAGRERRLRVTTSRSRRGRALMGGRVRRHLRHAGRSIRPRRRPALARRVSRASQQPAMGAAFSLGDVCLSPLLRLCRRLGPLVLLSLAPVAAALIYEHKTVATLDLAAINRAFFNSNAFVGAVFLAGICLDWLARR